MSSSTRMMIDNDRRPRHTRSSARAERSDLQRIRRRGDWLHARATGYVWSRWRPRCGRRKGRGGRRGRREVQGDNSRGTDNMKDQHRENQAKSGAAAGMAVAGSRNRQERRDERQHQRGPASGMAKQL